jgi:hypothetical protein
VAVESADEYCRAIEAYLCRKNDGHLVRIVGPAFEQVIGWASRGVPLKIACHGIDRYFERYYAKGPRRRPVRIEFCEADVLDAFDEWRRAVGIVSDTRILPAGAGEAEPADEATRRHGSLPAHLDRVIARLTALRGGSERALDEVLDAAIRELDGYRTSAKNIRGDARRALLERLERIDAELMAAARRHCDAAVLAQLARDADEELAPFKDRLSSVAFAESHRAAVDRLVRERSRLPVVAFD